MEIKIEPSPEILAAFRQLESEHEIYSGLEVKISDFESAVFSIPERVNTVILGRLTLDVLGMHKEAGISQLFHQAWHMAKTYFHVMTCNYTALTRSVLRSLNESNYTTSMLCARALVEHAAIAELRIAELEELAAQVTILRPSKIRKSIKTPEIAQVADKVWDLLIHLNVCFSAGRFNRDALKDHRKLVDIEIPKDNPMRQINVMDAIDALQWDEPLIPATTPRYYYELLCDYVHPNVGANITYVDIEQKTHCQFPGASERTVVVERVTALEPTDNSMRLHVVQVCYLPLRETLRISTRQIKRLEAVCQGLSGLCSKLRENGMTPLVRVT